MSENVIKENPLSDATNEKNQNVNNRLDAIFWGIGGIIVIVAIAFGLIHTDTHYKQENIIEKLRVVEDVIKLSPKTDQMDKDILDLRKNVEMLNSKLDTLLSDKAK
jgi:hypothetical protein